MKQLELILRGTVFAFALLLLFFMGSVGCSRAPLQSMSGSGNGSTGSATPWQGGNPTTQPNSQDTTNIQSGTNCSSGGSGSNGACNGWDQNGALSLLSGLTPINPAQSSVGSDLQKSIADLLNQAATNGAASVEQNCNTSQTASQNQAQGCYNRYLLAGQILQQCGQNLNQYAPQPGEPMLGTYTVKCPPIKGWTDGNISCDVTGDYNAYGVHCNFPRAMQMDGVGAQADNLDFEKKAGAGQVSIKITDLPDASHAHMYIYNKEAPPNPYVCDKDMKFATSNNPIPAKVAQGMKSLADCERKALLLMSPLFDTMFNNMQGQNGQSTQAMQLLMAAMNIGSN